MSDLAKKLLLIPFGTALGLILGGALWLAWKAVWPEPGRLAPSDVAALKKMLDDNRTPRGLYLYDPYTRYRFKPNFHGLRHGAGTLPHVTNSLGLLGSREIDSSPDVTRILLLGDSVTYGDGIAFADTFVAQMQVLAGPSFQLANSACPGWNTQQQLAFYQHYLGDVQWDVVVVVFCLNDLARFRWARTPLGRYEMIMSEDDTAAAKRHLVAARERFRQSAATRALAEHDDATLMAWDPTRWPAYLDDLLTPFLEQHKRQAIALVALPSRYQLEALALGAEPATALFPQRQLDHFSRRHGVAFIDAAEAFDLADQEAVRAAFRPDDYLHFSPAGHRQLAEFLWPRLAKTAQATGK